MPDREKTITALAICTGKCKCFGCWYGQNNSDFRCQDRLKEDALALLKDQETIKQKMWNALYSEEDKLEKQYAGTDKHDDWFSVYRPWLQRGFEIAIEVIAKQEGR